MWLAWQVGMCRALAVHTILNNIRLARVINSCVGLVRMELRPGFNWALSSGQGDSTLDFMSPAWSFLNFGHS